MCCAVPGSALWFALGNSADLESSAERPHGRASAPLACHCSDWGAGGDARHRAPGTRHWVPGTVGEVSDGLAGRALFHFPTMLPGGTVCPF